MKIDIFKNPQASGKIIHIGTGKEKTILSIAEKVASLMDYKKEFKFIEDRIGDVNRHCAEVTEAKDLIGWEPNTTFEEGIEETVEWYKCHPEAFDENII